jgi:nucleotidyltransferase/DNA polymerase involved in DNA repair
LIISDWPAAIAHIDADCFFAACELLRRPDLAGRPLCVLSSQDACIVAKTYDAKAAGITTGMPVWEARKRLPEAVYLPADFRFYGLLSDKLFAILRRFSPQVEEYSIDEGFVDLDGLRSYRRMGYGEMGDAMRRAIRQETGLTVSVGVSVTRTLAKMASEANKPDGLTVVSGRHIAEFLSGLEVADIPGIGRRRGALLDKFGIRTALDFARAPETQVQQLLGRSGLDLWRELGGISLFGVETEPRLPKSMARTASLGERSTDIRLIRAHLSHHCFRLGMDMLARGLTAQRLSVTLRLGNFERVVRTEYLPYPTQHLNGMQRTVTHLLHGLWRDGMVVNACGVIATGISPAGHARAQLLADAGREARDLPLWQAMQQMRCRFGNDIIRPAATLLRPGTRHSPARRFGYPMFVCK